MEIIMTSFHPTISIAYLPKSFSFELGASFRGLTITEAPDGYNIILRAYLKDGTAVYSMTQTQDIGLGLASLIEALSQKGGAKLWHFDKYANKKTS